MFDLTQFYSWVPERIIAGAFVCGKWPREIRNHQNIIAQIGLVNYENKIERLTSEDIQIQFWELMQSWLMGRATKLITENEFKDLLNRIHNYRYDFEILSSLSLSNYNENEHGDNLKNIWEWAQDIIENKAKLVAVSKFLHHIFPNLIVPIDREYTNKFFKHCNNFNRRNLKFNHYNGLKEAILIFQDIANNTREKLNVPANGLYANTSDTKTIDNWIIMWTELQLQN